MDTICSWQSGQNGETCDCADANIMAEFTETKRERRLLTGLSVALILTFLWQLVSPEHESPSDTLKFLTIALNTVGIIGLIGLTFRILTSTSPPGNAAGPWIILPVLGLASAVGLFVIG